MPRRRLFLLLGLFAILAATTIAGFCLAGEEGGSQCDRCGCRCACQRICRPVCEMKETTKVTYECRCEDICVPGPSTRVRKACTCGRCDSCRHVAWEPGCGTVKTRKVLEKKVEKVSKPTYKWVVEYVCSNCAK